MRLLVIEDDEKIMRVITRGLSQEGHTVDAATTCGEGRELWQNHQHDAVILDIMLPGGDGVNLLREMRQAGDQTPVLILSAKGAVDDRVTGLDSGADDYMVKPFSYSELAARVHAITRRTQALVQTTQQGTTLKISEVSLDLIKRSVVRDGRKIELQPKEFALLELLMRNPDKPLTKAFILESIWGVKVDPQTNIIDVLVCRLRNKLDTGFKKKLIHTMRGVGYVYRTSE